MISKELLKSLAGKNNISLSDKSLSQLNTYAELLIEWNDKINLTAITDPEEIVYKHFLDSMMPLALLDIPEGSSLIDVGTGAGFPGLVLKIVRPDLQITLLDGTNKRLLVIKDIEEKIGITTKIIHMRAEDGSKQKDLRESFDYATARAVTSMPVLSEYCIPYVKLGGYFIPLKGPDIQEELKSGINAINLLGGKWIETKSYSLGDMGERNLVIIQKTKPTPPKYPRQMAKIKKNPLG